MVKKRNREHIQNPHYIRILNYLYVLIGAAIIAISFNVFLLPNQIAPGGVSGISTILNGVFGWEPAYVQWALNIPLFIAGVIILGMEFGLKTFVGTVFLPFVVYLTKDWDPWTLNPLLAAIFGGMGTGLGIGIVFRGHASTGGTDLAAQILAKYTHLSLGICVAIIDGLIVLTAALVFDIEKGLFALLGLYITSKTIDILQIGWQRSKMVLIISKEEERIKKAVLEEIDRGLTKILSYGGFTNEKRPIFMVVIDQTEFYALKELVANIDPEAFVIVVDASEVLGKGFKVH
ncbi:MAG: YitT family protein [Caldibacillus sp.]